MSVCFSSLVILLFILITEKVGDLGNVSQVLNRSTTIEHEVKDIAGEKMQNVFFLFAGDSYV